MFCSPLPVTLLLSSVLSSVLRGAVDTVAKGNECIFVT